MVQKRAEAQDDGALARITLGLGEVESDVEAYKQANPDAPHTWGPYAQKTLAGYGKKVMGGEKTLTRTGREKVTQLLTGHASGVLGRLDKDANLRINAQAAGGTLRVARQLFAKGELEPGLAVLREGAGKGYFFDDQLQAYEAEGYTTVKRVKTQTLDEVIQADLSVSYPNLDRVVKTIHGFEFYNKAEKDSRIQQVTAQYEERVQTTSLQNLIQSDPAAAVKALDDREKTYRLSNEAKIQLTGVARLARESLAAEEVRSAQQAMRLLPPEKLMKTSAEELAKSIKQGDDWHRSLVQMDLDIKQGRAQINDAEAYESLVSRIDQYRGGTSAQAAIDKQRLQLEVEVRFAGDDLQQLQSRLEKRSKGEGEAVDMGEISSQLAKWKEQGKLGLYQHSSVDRKALSQDTARQRAIRETVEDEVRREVLKTSEEAGWRMAELVMRYA